MNEGLNFPAFLRQLDAICGRLNSGLSAVALVLAACVLVTGVIRGAEMNAEALAAQPASAAADEIQQFNGWTYF